MYVAFCITSGFYYVLDELVMTVNVPFISGLIMVHLLIKWKDF